MIVDGAIRWGIGGPRPAADGFNMEARKTAIYEWVRQIRGGVLAGAFSVERHISAAIVHFILGDRIGIVEVQDVFDEGLLAPLTFERRINVAMLIVPHVLPASELASLKADLGELRSLRNAMAHKPFWFHPELNDKGEIVNLVPMIMRGKAPLVLTTQYIEQVNTLISGLIDRTAILSVAAKKRPTNETNLESIGRPDKL
ncbi:hypothetical protein ACW7BC_11465 [Azospirillum argentinense]